MAFVHPLFEGSKDYRQLCEFIVRETWNPVPTEIETYINQFVRDTIDKLWRLSTVSDVRKSTILLQSAKNKIE